MSNKEMTTEKRLKVRLYLSLLVYTVVGYGLTLILDYIFSKFDNGIFAWLYWRLDLLFILYLMLGFICIFNYYWKKPWDYLDEVIDATQTVYEQNNHTVSLSEPLKELEGKAIIDYESQDYELNAGESFRFNKNGLHSVIPQGKFKMSLLLVIE